MSFYVRFRAIFTVAVTASLLLSPLAASADQSNDPALQAEKAHLQEVDDRITSVGQGIGQVQKNLSLTQSKQVELQKQIDQTAAESSRLLPELQSKTEEYQRKLGALREAIRSDYQAGGKADALEMLVTSGSISQSLRKSDYSAAVSSKLDQLAHDAARAEDDVHDRKQELDGKRTTLDVLSRQLDQLTQSLEQQRQELEELKANQSNEASYLATRIQKEEAAQTALLGVPGQGNALWGVYADIGPVKQGDVIGYEGSTGNSTGCHTHFSVIRDGQWVDPQPFLDSGIFRHPDGSESQAFGMTSWAQTGAYGGRIHNGIDFVQPCGAPVRAAADGTVIRYNRTDGSGFGHYIMIKHNNGLLTLYGHLI
jgi:peptidoglycan hydrolase CwlO-like protein